MKFERIAVVGAIPMPLEYQQQVQNFSEVPVVFPDDDPIDETTTIDRINGADAIIVTWRSVISKAVIDACPNVKFIGLAASAYTNPQNANIDLPAAAERGIVVSTLGQYGDEATAEWIFAQLLAIVTHNHELKWRDYRTELFGKTLGIIGMGHMGGHVAQRAQALGMRVVYWGRNRKPDAEAKGYKYLPLLELLSSADIVSVHISKGVQVMGEAEFNAMKPGALLVNTSIGAVFDETAFQHWLTSRVGFVISDADADDAYVSKMHTAPNGWVSVQGAADTREMLERRAQQLIENMQAYLAREPIRLQPTS